ncbi:MAG: NADH-quinone oxidoreductase subunit NuoE [Deltaproteobacteria bacterium]|nr:NADH-quinone oxidoreductase subunit NuoE [Deltaproteobacteria bacterium]
MPLSDKLKEKINKTVSKSETKQSALIPVFHEVQSEHGWLSQESMEEVAELLGIPPASVQNVATFYTMFFTKPVGKHVLWLCRTLSCALRGAEQVEHYLSEKLQIHTGETTPDGKITLLEAECLASCGTAPVMLIDDELHENLTKKRIDELIEKLRRE